MSAHGTYSVIVTFTDSEGGPVVLVLPPVTLVVAPGHFVPALEPRAIALLISVLAIAGIIAARRL